VSDEKNPGECESNHHEGKRLVDERCGDGYCRACHISLSFDDCVSGAWVDEQRREAGLPAMERGCD